MKTRLLPLLLFAATACLGSIPATCVWEVRTTGLATNGGGFIPGSSGTDFSQQDAAQYSVTDAQMFAANDFIDSATANFQTDVVGNVGCWVGGTPTIATAWFRIIARVSATRIQVDRTNANSTGGTFKIGGALDHPSTVAVISNIAFINTAGWDVYIKAGTYNFTSAGTNIATGRIQFTGATADTSVWEGYQTTRGDRGTKPVWIATTLAINSIFESLGYTCMINIEFDANAKGIDGLTSIGNSRAILCKASNGASGFNTTICDRCYSASNSAGFQNCPLAFACVAVNNTGTGFLGTGDAIRCIDINSPGGISMNAVNQKTTNCVVYSGTGTGGIQFLAASTTAINCIVMNRTGKGYSGLTLGNTLIQNCAGYNNSTGDTDIVDTRRAQGFITLTADPFVSAAGGNFALNSTSGGGAACFAAGIPGIFPNATTTSGSNVGAVESSGFTAGGGSYTFIN